MTTLSLTLAIFSSFGSLILIIIATYLYFYYAWLYELWEDLKNKLFPNRIIITTSMTIVRKAHGKLCKAKQKIIKTKFGLKRLRKNKYTPKKNNTVRRNGVGIGCGTIIVFKLRTSSKFRRVLHRLQGKPKYIVS